MKTAHKNDKTIAKRLSFGSCIVLMGLGCMAGIGGTTTVAQPLRVSQQPAAGNATAAAAQAAYDEGVQLYNRGTAESLSQAIAKFQEAAPLFAAVGNRKQEASCFLFIGQHYAAIEEKQKALDFYTQSLRLWRLTDDRGGEATALGSIGFVYFKLGENQKALDYYNQALPLFNIVEDVDGEAEILRAISSVYSRLGKKSKSFEYFKKSLEVAQKRPLHEQLFAIAQDNYFKAKNFYSVDTINFKLQALEKLQEAVRLFSVLNLPVWEGDALYVVGDIYSTIGETQKALDTYSRALTRFRAGSYVRGQGVVLVAIGDIYLSLGDTQKARDYYTQSLLPFEQARDTDRGDYNRGISNALYSLGNLYLSLGEYQKALDYHTRSLSIFRPKIKSDALDYFDAPAYSLVSLGRIYFVLSDKRKALAYYNKALDVFRSKKNFSGEAIVLNNIGNTYLFIGEHQKALDYFIQALSLNKSVGYLNGESTTLYNIAATYRKQGKLEQALEQINAAIAIIENLRSKIGSQDLRTSYFSTVQDRYEFKTDLLMQLHQKNPQKGYDKQALETADRSRARSLIELLTEAGINLKTTTESSPLLTQERQLLQALRQIEQQRVVLLSGNHTPAQAAALNQQSDTLVAQLQDLTTRLRATNPAYANLKYPQPLTAQQIQQQVVDKDTVVLQYALGETQSYLWVVTPTSIRSYTLPDRKTLETAAKSFRSAISNSGAISDAKRTGDALSKLILSPITEPLQTKRLLIVADGALQNIPFAALPLPNTPDYNPLLTNHEIINAPSASSIITLRQQQKPTAPKTIALFADPVFSNDDDRLTNPNITNLDRCAPTPNKGNKTTLTQNLPAELRGTLRDLDLRGIPRLPNTQLEAEQILALVPPAQRSAACAFAANYGRVTTPQPDTLNQYRIVHFATHGFINDDRPQFSGLLLSLVTPQGKPTDGFLRLRDIFNLKLAADLVVLSACQTGMGKNIRGEGIVGLTRGFMYAGSKRIVASLWSVDDEATAKLMGIFYQNMLKEKQTPAVALRNAQIQMWKANPNEPRLWAAFTLQGEWRP